MNKNRQIISRSLCLMLAACFLLPPQTLLALDPENNLLRGSVQYPEGSTPSVFLASSQASQDLMDSQNILLGLQASSGGSQDDPAVQGQEQYSGQTEPYMPQNFGAQGGPTGPQIYFNPDGTISRIDYFDPDTGAIVQKDTYYSNTGRYTEIEGYLNDGTVEKREYYQDGKLIREIYFNKDVTTKKILYYDPEDGIKFSEEEYYTCGIVKQRTRFDKSGMPTLTQGYYENEKNYYRLFCLPSKSTPWASEWYDQDGRINRRDEFDDNGRYSRTLRYDQNGTFTEEDRYLYVSVGGGQWSQVETFDAQGRKIKCSQYDPEGHLLSDETIAASSALTTEKKWYHPYSGSAPAIFRKAVYNAQGVPLELLEYDPSGQLLRTFDTSYLSDVAAYTQAGLLQIQSLSLTGLLPDNPNDTSFIYHEGIQAEWAKIYAYTQASTYEQGVIGIDFVKMGNLAAAKKIFDFYYNEWKAEKDQGLAFSGFYTVYNIDPANWWKKYEWRKTLGENAWIAYFLFNYAQAVPDGSEKQKALDLALEIGRWAKGLPHYNGGVAMGYPGNEFGSIYSVENNLDYYVLMKKLAVSAPLEADRQLFAAEQDAVKDWLKNEAYDPVTGFFRGGGYLSATFTWDNNRPLDVNSWAIEALGIDTLKNDLGIDIDAFVERIGQTFSVQDSGAFGGDVYHAKGFDFSDTLNAQWIGRQGMKWIEGTNQMIVLYRMLARYYQSIDPAKAAYYSSLAGYFFMRNADDTVLEQNALYMSYADREGMLVYAYSSSWRTPYGFRDPGAAAWAHFSYTETNPFDLP